MMEKELEAVRKRISQYLIDEEQIDEINLPELIKNISFDVLQEEREFDVFERTNGVWEYLREIQGGVN